MIKRLKNELNEFKKYPNENFEVSLPNINDIYSWDAIIYGPKDTIYENGKFKLSIFIPEHYPFESPVIKFITPMYHFFGCGLPGMIEYGSLVLYKHDIISKYRQKRLNTILYIFLRLPLCILGAVYNMLAYYNGYIEDPLWITLYVNIMLYFNGTLFTYLTGHSFYKLKYSKEN